VKYRLELSGKAERQMRGLPLDVVTRVYGRLQALREEPRGAGTKKLKGRSSFSARVGSYRVLYAIDDSQRVVSVTAVRHRREAYR
jgi:mRNA interferase RelE/StbE